MIKTLCRILFTTGWIALAGCSGKGMTVESGHDASYDFSRLHDWDWAPKNATLETPAAVKTSARIPLDSLVSSHVERTLGQKGFNHRQDKADFLVAWSFGEWQLERKSKPNGGYGAVGLMYPGLHGSNIPQSKDGRALPPSLNPYSSDYEEAKLEFVIMDARTSKIIWNGTLTDDSDFGYFESSQKNRIGAAVDQILSGFPPPGPTTH